MLTGSSVRKSARSWANEPVERINRISVKPYCRFIEHENSELLQFTNFSGDCHRAGCCIFSHYFPDKIQLQHSAFRPGGGISASLFNTNCIQAKRQGP